MRRLPAAAVFFFLVTSSPARRAGDVCGTTAETPTERLFLHRQALRRIRAAATAAGDRDIGNIAVIDDSAGVVARQNEFNLDLHTLRFTPAGTGYRYVVLDGGYDEAAASAGDPLAALDDDDTRLIPLPFAFPFFGASYREVWVNSDGNLTFGAADSASTDRSLGRMTAGPPRIAPLFDDVDPSRTAGGVRVLTEAGRVVVSWVGVPEWVASGIGARQTFQVALYRDGRIDFAYQGAAPTNALVGIAPGHIQGATALVDYRNDPSSLYTAAVAERFGDSLAIDVVTAAQRFYRAHEDAYDYLVIYNNMDIQALPGGVLAYESTVRSRGAGYGVAPRDDGGQYGSPSRLQAVLNLGPLSQYPDDAAALVPARAGSGDTPLTILGHESGHLFLAYASVNDPDDPTARPMLGYQNQHWSFVFNSEASLLEGERILDRGAAASPRFMTTDLAQGYAPLDQYLMGFLPPAGVPDTFVVTGAPSFLKNSHPASGVAFDGERRDIAIGELVQAMGRRTPDDTIAQRRYRFGFLLVTPQGVDPSAADLAKLESFRQQFEAFYAKAATGRASAETSLRRALKLSLFPSAGILQGAGGTATLTVETAPTAPMRVALQTATGATKFPSTFDIPAGATSVSFSYSGQRAGVEELAAIPADPRYETAFARVQVAGASQLRLVQVASDPVVVRLTDANGLVYPGALVVASAPAGGSVAPATAVTDAQGLVTFRWNPGTAAANQITLTLDAFPAVSLTLRAGSAVPAISAVVNAASYAIGAPAGGLATIFGANLAGARVSLNGLDAPVLYAGASQVNFYVPATAGAAPLSVTVPSGERATQTVEVVAIQPGIFTATVSGQTLDVYCTGLGPSPLIFVGATPLQPESVTPVSPGLYRLTVRLPDGFPPGRYTVLLSVSLAHSNPIQVTIP